MYHQPTTDELEQIWNWNLTNHTPTEEAIKKIETLRELAKDFAEGIIKLCPESRERDLSLTHLEDTVFDALAAVVRHETVDGPNPGVK